MIDVNEINVVSATANWQSGPTSLQINAEVIASVIARLDTIPESAKMEIENFITDRLLDLQEHYHQLDQHIPDVLIEYAPEIYEIVQLLKKIL